MARQKNKNNTPEAEREDLKRRLGKAEEALSAIRGGDVDTVVVSGADGNQIFGPKGTDHAYRVLVENMLEGVIVTTPDGTILYCNMYFAEMAGLPPEKVVGTSLQKLISSGSADAFKKILNEGMRKNVRGEVGLLVSGKDIPVLISACPLLEYDTPTICIIITDMQKEKETEALRQGAKSFRRLARKKTLEAELLKDEDKKKNIFISVLAHELRNPLTPLMASVQLLKKHEDAYDAERRRKIDPILIESIEMAERQVNNMSRLLDDLLDVSRIIHDKIHLKKQNLDISEAVACAVSSMKPSIDLRRQHISVSLPSGPICVLADPLRIEQIIVNILNNASKYTKTEGHISISVERENAWAVVRIKDDGMGIASDKLPHVFEPFYQSEHARERSQSGLGIGLALVDNLCRLHGGFVEAKSKGGGKGSEFIVRLPRTDNDILPIKKKNDLDTPKIKILIVDDNKDAAAAMAKLLTYLGHEVLQAHDGTGAITAAMSFQPDLILLDIGLPDMDGYDVARELKKEQGEKRNITIVAMSGYGQKEDKERSRKAGMDLHLVKPVAISVIQDVIFNISQKLPADGHGI